MNSVSLDSLISQGQGLLSSQRRDRMGFRYVDFNSFKEWERLALLYLQTEYPNHPQTKDFEGLVQYSNHDATTCEQMVAILKAFALIKPKTIVDVDYKTNLETIFEKFHVVANQLKRRHDGRETLIVKDEYDVQDLLEALFKLFFTDVRAEEWCPSYAGSSKRMDFLLKDQEIVVEVKMTRDGLDDKKVGEQLTIDIANYKKHHNCKQLFCFVYDPDGRIRNPRGIESDLSGETDGIEVFAYIYPR